MVSPSGYSTRTTAFMKSPLKAVLSPNANSGVPCKGQAAAHPRSGRGK